MTTKRTRSKATAKQRKPKDTVGQKVGPYVELGKGLYSDPNDDTLVIINPIEVLRANELPLTQEAAFAVYATVLKDANENDVSVVLIDEAGTASDIDSLVENLERSTHAGNNVSSVSTDSGNSKLDSSEEKPSSVQSSEQLPYEWDGVERRRLPRT